MTQIQVRTRQPGARGKTSPAVSLLKSYAKRARVPLNSMALRVYRQNALPGALYPAVEYLLTGRVPASAASAAKLVEALRERLARQGETRVCDYVAGTAPGGPEIEQRPLSNIAHWVSVPRDYGIFLYLCAEGFKARRMLELGACAGISGCYLASAPSCQEFITMEASGALSAIASENLRHVTPNATVINASFDDGLDELLQTPPEPFDLIWIDGHHESEPTLRYFQRLNAWAAPGSLMLFDDINWPQMHEAWAMIRRWPGFSHTISATRFGMAVLKSDGETRSPQNWRLERQFGITRLVREGAA